MRRILPTTGTEGSIGSRVQSLSGWERETTVQVSFPQRMILNQLVNVLMERLFAEGQREIWAPRPCLQSQNGHRGETHTKPKRTEIWPSSSAWKKETCVGRVVCDTGAGEAHVVPRQAILPYTASHARGSSPLNSLQRTRGTRRLKGNLTETMRERRRWRRRRAGSVAPGAVTEPGPAHLRPLSIGSLFALVRTA